MLWVKLQLLFDSVLHQKADVAVRHWKAATHIHLLFGLLCCSKTQDDKKLTPAFLFSFAVVKTDKHD